MVKCPWPARLYLDPVWPSTHVHDVEGGREAAALLPLPVAVAEAPVSADMSFYNGLWLHTLQSITCFGAMGCVGKLCRSVAAFSCFLFVSVQFQFEFQTYRKEYNEHQSTIHLVSTITNIVSFLRLITESFHSKLKTS